jgi:subtilisin family serine protease
MAKKGTRSARRRTETARASADLNSRVSADADALLLAALERGGDTSKTGRYLITFKEGAAEAAVKHLRSKSGLRMAHARDFTDQAVMLSEVGDADAVVLPDIRVALVGGGAAREHALTTETSIAADDPFHSIDPEYFVFARAINSADYLLGVRHTAEMIARDLGLEMEPTAEPDVVAEAVGATWGLTACKVPSSTRDGTGIRVAVLDTGFDLGHPEFAGRAITSRSFVADPVQDLHGHGTHTAGTACGPNSPAGAFPRYGIAFKSQMFIGKVLSNSGAGTQMQSLAGMNWAIANGCAVISMSLGAPVPPQPAYTAAGQAALNAGCLIVAAAGNSGPGPTEAPGNSPTIVAVAAVDSNLRRASFSCVGKVDIAGPGVNVFSSWLRPLLHNTISGTSMATPHVAGCAALWAQTSPGLRGVALRQRLFDSARSLHQPPTRVGNGLVQAPA